MKIDTDLNVTNVNDDVTVAPLSKQPAAAVETCATILNVTFQQEIMQLDDSLGQNPSSGGDDDDDDHNNNNNKNYYSTGRRTADSRDTGAWNSRDRRRRWKRQSSDGEQWRYSRRQRITRIDTRSSDCGVAVMSPQGFVFRSAGWDCPGDLVLDRRLWQCKVFGKREFRIFFFLP
jgi:hypothetical protein